MQKTFVNYAHRGASTYMPENTMLSFYTGIFMGANGIETDVQRAKDGTLVLFHDSNLLRVTGSIGSVSDYTFAYLQALDVVNGDFKDKIVSLEDFLMHFSFRDITFAIELKGTDVEKDTAELLRRYNMADKTVVTSFQWDYLCRFRAYAPEFAIGYLTDTVDESTLLRMQEMHFQELCPKADLLTEELVKRWHEAGFRVRAWGVKDEDTMCRVYGCGVDGMTVNFPDKLTALLNQDK